MTRLRENRRKMYPRVRPLPLRNYVNIDIQHSMLPIGRDDLAVAIAEETWKAVSGVRGDDERMRGKRRADDERTDDSNTEVDSSSSLAQGNDYWGSCHTRTTMILPRLDVAYVVNAPFNPLRPWNLLGHLRPPP